MDLVRPHTYIALSLASGQLRVLNMIPDTNLYLGKYGNIPVNSLLGRPFYLTFEVEDEQSEDSSQPRLRVVPASELHAEALTDDPSANEVRDEGDSIAANGETTTGKEPGFDLLDDNGKYIIRNNRLTIDDNSRQALDHEDIEELKRVSNSGSGRDVIARILQGHANLDEKTAYSLAKYQLRKTKKYLRRFTLLPVTVNLLTRYLVEQKDAPRIMELREEVLGLISSWVNVHMTEMQGPFIPLQEDGQVDARLARRGSGRWLVADETGGLIVALMAERMGILHPSLDDSDVSVLTRNEMSGDRKEAIPMDTNGDDAETDQQPESAHETGFQHPAQASNQQQPHKARQIHPEALAATATSNYITLLHTSTQPNLSLLSYFTYDGNNMMTHSTLSSHSKPHPLHMHLRTISYLQLLHPQDDPGFAICPDSVDEKTLQSWKSSKRGAYHRKMRRWERTQMVVNDTRAGEFDGLVIASNMDPKSVLACTVPLLRGGAPVVVYSKDSQPLVEVCDMYSTGRKTAFINAMHEARGMDDPSEAIDEDAFPKVPSDDFPVDPRLLLAPTLQTARAKQWQVLPGRTHPVMTSRGGPEGYLFTATRVIPTEGTIKAKGRFSKKRKTAAIEEGTI